MKKLILTFAGIIALGLFASAQTVTTPTASVDNPNQAEIKFDVETHDFATVKEGVQATYEFKFTNTGNEPLILTNVQASCGCTTPKWSKEPLKKGESGVISAVYNSTGRPGAFNKAITITSNAKTPSKVIFIKGTVEPKPVATEVTPVKTEQAGPMEKKPVK